MRNTADDHEWRARLADSLATFASEAETDDLRLHLGDLREGCLHAVELIERLAVIGPEPDPVALRTTLSYLRGELLHHLIPHIHGVTPSLVSVTSRLYAEAEERGEFD